MKNSLPLVRGLLVALFLVFSACGDDTPDGDNNNTATDAGNNVTDTGTTADAGPDAGDVVIEPATQALLPEQPGVDAAGLPADTTAEAGQARAVAVGTETGFTGIWSHCKLGDVRLVNAEIDVCISGTKSNRYELFTGGAIVDLKRIGEDADDFFDVLKPRAQFNVQLAETVEVIRDGTDGGPAVVRVTGPDTPVAHFVGAIGATVLRSQDLDMITEYRLWPDSNAVEIFTQSANNTGGNRTYALGDWTAYGDAAAVFRPQAGFDIEANATFTWTSGFADGRAYGLVHPEELTSESLPFGDIPWVITNNGNITTMDGDVRTFFRWLVVGERDAESIRQIAGELGALDLSESEQTVVLEDDAGNPLADRLVQVWSGEEAITALVTDSDGRATFRADADTYRITAQTIPGEPAFDEDVAFDGESTITLQQAGQVRVQVDASAGGSSGTARVTLFGPGRVDGVALHGDATWSVAPGTWRVVVQKGPEWSVHAEDVTVTAGQNASVDATIAPVLDTDAWISADFHQHMEPSIDSTVTVIDRVLDNVGHGVEFVAPTDHEAVTDLVPYIEELGLEDEMGTFPGVEISPAPSHIGVYPLEYQADERGRGSIPLAILDDDGVAVQRTIPEIIEIARQLPTDPLVQLNHARDGSGLFNTARFDPEVDPTTFIGPTFTLDFDVMEVINGFSDVCLLFTDFAGLWNAGYTPTALGNSDSHGKWGGVGQPRNWLHIDKDVDQVTTDDIRTAMLEHRVSVGANTFIDFGDGRLPGDTITSSAGANVDFHVRVQTAEYASANTLITVANGTVIDRRPITSISDTLDFDEVVSFSFDEDTWVSFFVWGPRPTGDVSYGHPVMGFTNPVMVDVDGDSDNDGDVFEPIGFGPLDLDQLDNNYCSF